MIKKVLVFALAIALGSVADAQVVWNRTEGLFPTTAWEATDCWSVTGTTT